MKARLNPYKAAPEAMKSLGAVETYVQGSGLEPSLIDLVKTRASQINGCAYCIHIHTREARGRGERSVSICSTPGAARRFTPSASGRRWRGPGGHPGGGDPCAR
jgi:alkylhydroperoxidase AhpD family core domain